MKIITIGSNGFFDTDKSDFKKDALGELILHMSVGESLEIVFDRGLPEQDRRLLVFFPVNSESPFEVDSDDEVATMINGRNKRHAMFTPAPRLEAHVLPSAKGKTFTIKPPKGGNDDDAKSGSLVVSG